MAIKSFNMWQGLSAQFQNELRLFLVDGTEPVEFPLLKHMSEDTREFFSSLYDEQAQDSLFSEWTHPGTGKKFKLRSFYMNKPENIGTIKSDLDAMASTYSNDFAILGLWKCETGEQVGGDESPLYPVPALTLNFMPPVMVDPGDPEADPVVPPTYEDATQLSDINVLYGQEKRHFPVL